MQSCILDDGKSCQAIAEYLYLDDDTIRGWYKTYREAGWDALSVDGWKGGQSRMTSTQDAELCTWLEGRFCRSASPIMAHIAAQYGLKYAHSGCLKLLARLGFVYRKPKGLPRVASPEQQAAFIDMYERLLNELGQMKRCISPTRCIPNTRQNPAMAGSRRAQTLPSQPPQGAGG